MTPWLLALLSAAAASPVQSQDTLMVRGRVRVAVLALAPTADGQPVLPLRVTRALASRLARDTSLDVITLMNWSRSTLDSRGAGYGVTGRLVQGQGDIRLHVHLFDARTNRILVRDSIRVDTDDIDRAFPVAAAGFATAVSQYVAARGPGQMIPRPTATPRDSMAVLLARCPTPAEIAFVNAGVRLLDFAGDPTAGTLVCTAGAGSADLTRLQARTYMTLVAMSRLTFSRPLRWTGGTLWDWFTSQVAGIRFRRDMSISMCCAPAAVLNIQTQNLVIADFDTYDAYWGAGMMALLVHEARHIAFGGHTCGSNDRTIDEQGAWGVQYEFLQLLASASDTAFIPGPERQRIAATAAATRRAKFCQEP